MEGERVMNTWRKVATCEAGACLETSEADGFVSVRSSQRPNEVARFSRDEWEAFVAGLRATESVERGEVEEIVRRYFDMKDEGECRAAFGLIGELRDALAGRLLPPVVQTREEWGVRVIDAAEPPVADQDWPIELRRTEATAREYLAYLARVDGTRTTYGVRGELVVRTISTLADDGSPYGGATLTGKWRNVDE